MRYLPITLLFLFSSCIGTRITSFTGKPKMVKGTKILLVPIKNMKESSSRQLFETAKSLLRKTNEVLFLPDQEYAFLEKGISKDILYQQPISDSLKTLLAQHLGVRYIIQTELLFAERGAPT